MRALALPADVLAAEEGGREYGLLCELAGRLLEDRKRIAVQFMSASPGEGVSTVASGFALAACRRLGKRALLVDGDQRCPAHEGRFRLKPLRTTKPSGLIEPVGRIRKVEGEELYLVRLTDFGTGTAGDDVARLERLLSGFRGLFDIIITDLPSTRATRLVHRIAPLMDGVVLVVEAEKHDWRAVDGLRQSVAASGGAVLGAVLNKKRRYLPRWVQVVI